jgi:hypothetical protein
MRMAIGMRMHADPEMPARFSARATPARSARGRSVVEIAG